MRSSLVVLGTLFAGTAAAGKLDEWKKARGDLEIALRCEAGFMAADLKQIDTDPALQSDMTAQNTVKPQLEARLLRIKGVVKEPIASDQECNDKMAAALRRVLNERPHAKLEDVEATANGSVAAFLLGRLGVAQARLGKGNRLKTGMAFLIKDRLQTMRESIRRPVNELGKDAEVQQAAGSDPLLAYWIGLGVEYKTDTLGDAINDIDNNIDSNNAFTYDGTSYDKIKEAMQMSAGYERAVVAQVNAGVVAGSAVIEKKQGEDVVKVAPATYSVVFFKPMEFTATECAGYVNTGEWRFNDNGLSPVQRCKQLVDVKARYTLPPVAIDPEVGKLLKPGSSNLNCLLNQSWIATDAADGKKLASFGAQSVYAHAAGDRRLVMGATPNQYNQPDESYTDSCVPLAVYDGVGAKRTLKMWFGIALD